MNVTRFADWDLKSIIWFGFVLEKKIQIVFLLTKRKRNVPVQQASVHTFFIFSFVYDSSSRVAGMQSRISVGKSAPVALVST